MPGPSIRLAPFSEEHLDASASLLEQRHIRHRKAEPLLAAGGEREALRAALQQGGGATGAVGFEGAGQAGYVLGHPADSPVFGRSMWIGHAGFAATRPELLRDLYAAAAAGWVASGFYHHYVYAPALPELLQPWYRLGFGQMHVEAIRDTSGKGAELPQGVEIRDGSIDDVEGIAIPLNDMIAQTQSLAPSFSSLPEVSIETQAADWLESFEDPSTAYFVVERGGVAIGHSLVYRADPEFGNPRDARYLASTVVVPEERGSGIGSALVDHVLAWARGQGYTTLITNWRVTNLMASRFWPGVGWRPTFIRLQRVAGVH
ncbi:MAG: hypothetical protein QOH48_1764 [Actinomycetota bacterium]|jgi:GNAT superfamily N-acetyltransferase|nr:hypothetical protein [Actinomycetota bacterium]